jgi:protein-glutamine gamma-glutamyltransferase
LPFFARTRSPFLLRLRFNLDEITYRWNQWVLSYDTERQFAFLTRLGMEDITWQRLAMNLLAGVALIVGVLALLMLRHLYKRDTDAVQRLYLRFCASLAKHGLTRAPHEGAQDFARRAIVEFPQQSAAIANITGRYLALRYEYRNDPALLQAFRREVAAFKL